MTFLLLILSTKVKLGYTFTVWSQTPHNCAGLRSDRLSRRPAFFLTLIRLMILPPFEKIVTGNDTGNINKKSKTNRSAL
ncbi:MAG: hypothetical protein CVU39_00210 [Chloroflexi bacterium HGW-Chloroflexi-10]|nr:MAG: hypothetical protein CVU39_00210 [Chloroflexi bacterium HGW-Chloroflexi-10]